MLVHTIHRQQVILITSCNKAKNRDVNAIKRIT